MPANYVLLEKVVVGAAGAASVTFNSIPQSGYTDLVVKYSTRDADTGGSAVYVTFNGLSTNRSMIILQGTGSAASSGTDTVIYGRGTSGDRTASTFSNGEIYIPNYTSSNYKSVSIDSVEENNATAARAAFTAGLWSSTAAITSVTLTPSVSPFVQYSTFYLYGVAALGTTPVIAPKATGGDIIDYDGTYWIHTFLSSGTFTPAANLSCDYLVVAGGGGGGWDGGGGGGAGGLRSTVTATGGGGTLESALSLASGTGYTVTIGAGGAVTTTSAANGSNSVFSTITSTGGGAGRDVANAGITGGSGGGGGMRSTSGGSGTANQGRAGGRGAGSTVDGAAGGGGGANTVGADFISVTIAGAGGAGVATVISGTSTTYAGGGGGSCRYVGAATPGAGGAGGGGAGGASGQVGIAGTANLGGGGGGGAANASAAGGAGGSGVVIVRYLAV
jgi:hypothetical protein